MKRAAFLLLLVITSVACDPGPMPEIPRRLTDAERRADWFPSTSYDPYPLDEAILVDRVDEVRRLLESGTSPNRRWSQSGDRFPLQEVVDKGGQNISNDTEIVRLLLAHGADPNAKWCPFESRGPSYGDGESCSSAKGMAALSYAAILGRRDIVGLLLQAGAVPDDVVFELISRAMFPDLETRDQKSLAWLDRHFKEPITPAARETPLTRALSSWRWDNRPVRGANRVRIVLSLGADPNERAGDGRTPLWIALSTSPWLVKSLLEHGADVNQRSCGELNGTQTDPACTNENGMTPLMGAAGSGSTDLVALLLEFKADRSLTDWKGRSALHYAKWRNVWDLLKAP